MPGRFVAHFKWLVIVKQGLQTSSPHSPTLQLSEAVMHEDERTWGAAVQLHHLICKQRAVDAWREYVASIARPKVRGARILNGGIMNGRSKLPLSDYRHVLQSAVNLLLQLRKILRRAA
eukprot:1162128-Pelagomonas_calceolata.AAC.5